MLKNLNLLECEIGLLVSGRIGRNSPPNINRNVTLISKAGEVKMWESISKGETMEYFAYALFAAAITLGLVVR